MKLDHTLSPKMLNQHSPTINTNFYIQTNARKKTIWIQNQSYLGLRAWKIYSVAFGGTVHDNSYGLVSLNPLKERNWKQNVTKMPKERGKHLLRNFHEK